MRYMILWFILRSYLYYHNDNKFIDTKPLKDYFKIILESLFVLYIPDPIIFTTEFLKPVDPIFAPFPKIT